MQIYLPTGKVEYFLVHKWWEPDELRGSRPVLGGAEAEMLWPTQPYISFFKKFYYLATVIDAYTREIIGYELGSRHNTKLVSQALFNALKTRQNITPEIFHSDQGSEYRSKDFTKLLTARNIKISMSKKASPWQNGRQESLYGKFKLELGHPEIYQNIGELIEAIILQIHYYNNDRIHSALKCPPKVFYNSVKDSGANALPNKRQKNVPDKCGLLNFFGLHLGWLQEKYFARFTKK